MDDNLYQPPGTDGTMTAASGSGFGPFDASKAFSQGWEAFSRNMGNSIGVFIVLLLLLLVAVFSCVGWIVLPHLAFGFTFMGLYAARGRLEMSHAFIPFQSFGPVLGFFIITFLINLAVSMPFSGPTYYLIFQQMGEVGGASEGFQRFAAAQAQLGFGWWTIVNYLGSFITWYIGARFLIAAPLLVERDIGVIEAIKQSWAATNAYHFPLFGYYIAAVLIMAGGVLLCILPGFFTMPLGVVLLGTATRQLMGEAEGE